MKAGGRNLKVIHNELTRDIGQSRTRRLKIVAAVVGLAVLLAGAAWWSHPDSEPAQKVVAPEASAAHTGTTTTEYFPSQYTNQATEIEEHIQAF